MWRVADCGFLIFACALLLALPGCNNNPHPPPYHKTRPDGSPWIPRYSVLTGDPKSFDPQVSYDAVSRRVLEPVYDTLLQYHVMKTEPYELEACMLEEMPKREDLPDGTSSYLCKLKPGILFHDDPCFPGGKGREVVAADVHYAFQRIADPKVESPFFATLEPRVVGLREARAAGTAHGAFDYSTPVRGIEVIDAHTFRIRLTSPYPIILYYLAMHATCPVSREAVEYYDGLEHGGKRRPAFKYYAVGTGPFRIREYVPKQRVRLERIPNYHTTVFPSDGFPPEKAEWLQQFAGKPLPLVDEILLTILSETIPAFVLGRQGYLDALAANKDAFGAIMTMSQELTPKYRARGMTLEKEVTASTFFMSFNMDDPVVGKNVKLRKALSCAYDVATYSEIFYSGVAPVSEQLLPRGLFGYDKNYRNPNGYNLEKAKNLLAEAGYPNGRDARTGAQLELTLEEPVASTDERQRAEYNQRAFETLGIKIKVSENTFARVLERLEQGTFQVGSGTGWNADYPDPENFFFLFYSKNFPKEGANYCRYNRPDFDRLYEKMATMENSPERLELVQQMNAMLAEDCPMILEFDKAFYTAVQPWGRWTHNNQMLEGGFKYFTIDPEMRQRLQHEWNAKPVWPIAVGLVLLGGGLIYAVRWNRRQNV